MIQALKLKFKSKVPVSKRNRMINLCIDTTTCLLIVGMFFFARHLRQLMPELPADTVKHPSLFSSLNSQASSAASAAMGLFKRQAAAPAAPASVAATATATATAATSSVVASAAPAAQAVLAAPAASTITAAPGAMQIPPADAPGSPHSAEANLGGWISNTPRTNQPAAAAPAGQEFKTEKPSLGSAMASALTAPAPARAMATPSGLQPLETRPAVQPSLILSAKPPPASLGESMLAALTPSARGETIQPEIPSLKTLGQPTTIPSARQALRAQATARPTVAAPLTEDQKLLQAAEASVDHVLDLAENSPDIFGFVPGEPIHEAKLGDPIRVYNIPMAERRKYQPGQPINQMLQPANEWLCPVMLANRVRFMVSVKRVAGEYVAGTSSRSLAIVYEKIQDRWPSSDGFHPQLVANINNDSYYFTVPELPDANLTDSNVMFEYNPTLSPASVILSGRR